MDKDTFYFSHDYNARNDPKIKSLLRQHGMLGYGIWWALVEDLYNNKNCMPLDYECIAFDLRVSDVEVVRSVLDDFDLFVKDDVSFGSMSVETRLKKREAKSKIASENARKRWDKADAMQTHSKGNAIKERKGKESIGKKGNEIVGTTTKKSFEERKNDFFEKLQPYTPAYTQTMIKRFFEYWTETDKNGKMRHEAEKFFEMGKRLATWARREKPENVSNGGQDQSKLPPNMRDV